MKVKTPEIGTICASAQGRDKGNLYVVLREDGPSFVLVVDGIRRKLDSPKRKNIKHLALTPRKADEFGADFSNGKVNDCSVAYALKQYGLSKK